MIGTGLPLGPRSLSLLTFSSVSLSYLTLNIIFHSFPSIILSKTVSLHLVPCLSFSFSVFIYVHFYFFCLRSIQLFLLCSYLVLCHCSTPLQESQRMQTKLDALTREVFDLQETINWKDKKIGVGGPTRVL